MKLTFEGWQRVVMVHTHQLLPVKKEFGSWWPNKKRKSLAWTDAKTVYAKVEGLELTGNFLVRMDFTERSSQGNTQARKKFCCFERVRLPAISNSPRPTMPDYS